MAWSGRNYYGLPITLARDEPKVVADYVRSASRGEVDLGVRGLHVGFRDSDPWWSAVIFQHGVPIATVECIANQQGLLRGLAEDSPETLMAVFGIRC